MRAHVRKWGNSASIRIPAAVMSGASLSVDQAVAIREEGGVIVIEPIRPSADELERLLDSMTPDTFHDDIDFGPARGGEVW